MASRKHMEDSSPYPPRKKENGIFKTHIVLQKEIKTFDSDISLSKKIRVIWSLSPDTTHALKSPSFPKQTNKSSSSSSSISLLLLCALPIWLVKGTSPIRCRFHSLSAFLFRSAASLSHLSAPISDLLGFLFACSENEVLATDHSSFIIWKKNVLLFFLLFSETKRSFQIIDTDSQISECKCEFQKC